MEADKQAMQPPSGCAKQGSLAGVNAEQSRRRYAGKKARILARINPR
jgi:hypothetical protein